MVSPIVGGQKASLTHCADAETFHVELRIRNPLCTPLTVSQISVAFADLSGEPVELASDAVPDIELSAEEERIVSVATQRCYALRSSPSSSPFQLGAQSSQSCAARTSASASLAQCRCARCLTSGEHA